MNKDECEQSGGTWDEGTQMCTHPESAESSATPSDDANEESK